MGKAAAKPTWSDAFRSRYRKLEAEARTNATARRYLELVEDGIADLEAEYCDGLRMRGPRVNAYCEHLLADTRWRIIYQVRHNIPHLVLFGEHHLRVSAELYLSGATGDPSKLVRDLGLGDVYREHAVGQLHLSEDELKQVEAIIQAATKRQQPQKPCCT